MHELLYTSILGYVQLINWDETLPEFSKNKDHFSSFEELLSKDKSVTAHQRNLQILVTEMYKILNGL